MPGALKKMYLGDTNIQIKRCKCGWQFLSLYGTDKQCPACRSERKFCLKCGNIFKSDNLYCESCKTDKRIYCPNCKNEKENPFEVFCDACKIIDKNIPTKKESARFKFFKQTQKDCPHAYDCLNCPEPDCIVPTDEPIIQRELFT
jgi:hypothetical protein